MTEEFGIEVDVPKIRVYVAARSGLVDEAKACAKMLRSEGIHVESTWHDDPRFHNDFANAEAGYCDDEAERDIAEIQRSTHMVRLSDGDAGTGGNCCEFGAAWILGLVLILVGPPCNVFDRAKRVITACPGSDIVAKIRA